MAFAWVIVWVEAACGATQPSSSAPDASWRSSWPVALRAFLLPLLMVLGEPRTFFTILVEPRRLLPAAFGVYASSESDATVATNSSSEDTESLRFLAIVSLVESCLWDSVRRAERVETRRCTHKVLQVASTVGVVTKVRNAERHIGRVVGDITATVTRSPALLGVTPTRHDRLCQELCPSSYSSKARSACLCNRCQCFR